MFFLCHRAVAAPHLTGLGKALLASGPDEDLETHLVHAQERSLPSSAFDQEAFRAEIAVARSRRCRFDDGESLPGVHCLAVAIVAQVVDRSSRTV
jgi:DNA-binding IclR family transcriptional regulator